MLQLLGVLLIFNGVICTVWLMVQGKLSTPAGFGLLSICVVTGMALVLNERAIELTFGKYATLKAAAKEATDNADAVAQIRKDVEAQAATINLVAKDSADARTLVEQLNQENAKADEKLKALTDKTSGIVQLPDGRIVMGSSVSGSPSILQARIDDYNKLVQKNDLPGALLAMKDCIRLSEDSRSKLPQQYMETSNNRIDPIQLYLVGARISAQAGDFATAIDWAIKADAAGSTPETQQLLKQLEPFKSVQVPPK